MMPSKINKYIDDHVNEMINCLSSLVSIPSVKAAPEENMPYRVHPEVFERKVRGIMDAAESGADLPPLIVNYENGNFTLNDGNHRYEAYSRLGRRECEVIIWTTAEQDMTDFKEKHGF